MKTVLLALACGLGAVIVVSAQDPKKIDKPPAQPADNPPRRPNMTPEQMVDFILQRMDADRDGKISRAEAKNRIADNFEAIDVNKDGSLDRQELLTMAGRIAPLMQGPRAPGPGGFRPGGFAGRSDSIDFDALDKNADGRLKREELKGTRFADFFDTIDRNHDGKIDPKEWEAYHNAKK